MDALPPPPPAQLAPSPAMATATYAVGARERELCEAAASPDWLYLGATAVLAAGGIAVAAVVRYDAPEGVRLLPPAALGFGWGAFVGSVYPATLRCRPMWVGAYGRDGKGPSEGPVMWGMALAAGVTAPVLLGMAQGFDPPAEVSIEERVARLVIAGTTAFAGALVPYLLPPRPLRALREIRQLRLDALPPGPDNGPGKGPVAGVAGWRTVPVGASLSITF